VGVLRRDLAAAVQERHALIELAEVHVAEAQVVEEIGIVGILIDGDSRAGGWAQKRAYSI